MARRGRLDHAPHPRRRRGGRDASRTSTSTRAPTPRTRRSPTGRSSSTSARGRTCATSRCRTGSGTCSTSTPSAPRRARTSTISSLVVSLGSQLSRTNVEAGLTAPGSDSEMLGLYFADQNQVLDHHTLQDHISPQRPLGPALQGRPARRVRRRILRAHPGRAGGAEDRRLPDEPEPHPRYRRRVRGLVCRTWRSWPTT